jgi:hypothetical protein
MHESPPFLLERSHVGGLRVCEVGGGQQVIDLRNLILQPGHGDPCTESDDDRLRGQGREPTLGDTRTCIGATLTSKGFNRLWRSVGDDMGASPMRQNRNHPSYDNDQQRGCRSHIRQSVDDSPLAGQHTNLSATAKLEPVVWGERLPRQPAQPLGRLVLSEV